MERIAQRRAKKNLVDFARYWAKGGQQASNPAALQTAAEGMGFQVPQSWLKRPEPQAFKVWPENWPAVELFLRCQTQWRVSQFGRVGLDYPAVIVLARLYRVRLVPDLMDSLQQIEFTILEGA